MLRKLTYLGAVFGLLAMLIASNWSIQAQAASPAMQTDLEEAGLDQPFQTMAVSGRVIPAEAGLFIQLITDESLIDETVTNEAGYFYFRLQTDGHYKFRVLDAQHQERPLVEPIFTDPTFTAEYHLFLAEPSAADLQSMAATEAAPSQMTVRGQVIPAEASLRIKLYQVGETEPLAETYTTPDGLFNFGEQPSGRYYFQVIGRDGSPVALLEPIILEETSLHPTAILELDYEAQSPEAEQETSVAPQDTSATNADSLSGRITAADTGLPLSNVKVRVYENDFLQHSYSSSTTDADGYYSFSYLSPHDYYLLVEKSGTYPQTIYDGQNGFSTATPITINSGVPITIDIAVQPGGALQGTLTDTQTGGPLVREQPYHSPIYIRVLDPVTREVVNSVKAEADSYVLSGTRAGDYILQAYAPSSSDPFGTFQAYASEYYPDVYLFDEATPITISSGMTQTIDFSLEQGAIIDGQITDPDTGALLNIDRVVAYNMDDPSISFEDKYLGNGYFFIRAVTPGTYTLYFEYNLPYSNNSSNAVSSYYGGSQTIKSAATFTVTSNMTKTVNHIMAPGGVIDGLLTINQTGGNASSMVTAYNATTGHIVRTGAQTTAGYYKVKGLPSGEYILKFDMPYGFLSEYYPGVPSFDEAVPVSVTLGMTTTVDYAVHTAGVISGTLTDAQTGQPLNREAIGRVVVENVDIYEYIRATYVVNEDGSYSINNLLPGPYRVFFEADLAWGPYTTIELNTPYYSQYYDSSLTAANATLVDVKADTITSVDQAFPHGGTIEGTITDLNTGEILTRTAVAQVQAHNLDTGKIDSTQEIGEDGRYQIIGLPTGNYALFFEASTATNYDSSFHNHVQSVGEATPIAITNGMTFTLDYAFKTKGSIEGVLTDLQTGLPVDNTSIQSIVLHATAPDVFPYPNTSISTQVNGDGSYEFVNLKSGFYQIEYKPYANSPYLTDFYGGVKEKEDATLIKVTADEVTIVNYGMRRGGTIAGTVTDATTGQAATMELFQYVSANNSEQTSSTAVLDEAGRYSIPKLRPGIYQVYFRALTASGYVSDYYLEPAYGSIAQVTVTEAMTTTVNYGLMPGSTIYGTLTDAETGEPITSADIFGLTLFSRNAYNGTGRATLNDQGEFEFSNLPPGKYDLIFEARSNTYDVRYAVPLTIGAGTSLTMSHQLHKGAVVSGVVTAAESGLPLTNLYIRIRGINDCGVYINGYISKHTYTQADGSYQLDGLSNGDYILEFASSGYNQNIPYLTARQKITISDYQPVTADQTLRLGGAIEGYITAEDTGLPLENVYVLAFTRSYNELLGEYVYRNVNGTLTDQDGFYHIDKLDSAEYFVQISTRGNSPYISEGYKNIPFFDKESYIPLTVIEGETLTGINESLVRGGQISGQVKADDTGEILTEDFWIYLYPQENFDESIYYYINPREETYISTGLPDGDYIVRFRQAGFSSNVGGYINEYYGDSIELENAAIVTIENGQSVTNITASVSKGGNIYGEVFTERGYSQDTPVYLYDANGSLVYSTYSDRNYGYSLFGLQPGTYYILFNNYSFFYYNNQCKGTLHTFYYGTYYGQSSTFEGAQPVEVKAGEIVTGIDGVLSNTAPSPRLPEAQLAFISGTVKDQDGQPIANTRINFNDSANRAKQASTDENGDYQIELQKGQYVLTANRTGYPFSPPQALIQLEEDMVQDFTGEALPLNSTITGMVTAEGTQTPLPNIDVDVYQLVDGFWDFVQTTSTDDSGGYAFSLTAAPYRLYFADPSGVYTAAYYGNTSNLYQAQTIVLEAGQAATADVALTAQSPAITVDSGSYTVDPATGETIITVANGQTEQIQISYTPECPTGTPQNVKLVIGFKAFDMTANGNGTFSVSFTVPDDIDYSAPMIVQYECEGKGYAVVAGQLELYDPSGIITDITTGAVISNAVVTLYRIPHALPDTAAQVNQCRTAETRPATTGGPFGAWSGLPAADLSLDTPVNAAVDEYNGYPLFEPAIPSQQTNTAGYYGWDVAEGCWFVTVEAEGYQTAVSPVVGVPPAVLDLDIALTPEGGPPPPPPNPTIYLPIITD